jgi:NADPH:quinone reductase-like Zn-dependent oxidoreductase
LAGEELSPAACSMVTQLAREAGAYVVGTGRAADPQTALDFGAQEFVDLENDVDRAPN